VLIDVFNLDTPTLWKIVVHGNTADVTVGGGDYRTIGTDIWRVVSKSVSALVLVDIELMDNGVPASYISTMTIDAENGNFIHVFSGRVLGVNQLTV
jgi:hypothetical protein